MQGTTEIITDEALIIEAIRKFQADAKKFWCACVDSLVPAFSVGRVKEGYIAAKKRGVSIMYITEITRENLSYCKEIIEFAELRHLDAVQGNFAINETEYIIGEKKGSSMNALVRTSVRELVRQQHLIFQVLWHHAIPAGDRIAEIA